MADEKGKRKAAKPKQALPAKKIKQGKNSNNMTANVLTQDENKLKVKLPIKLVVIGLSVLALSWFFEGVRQIQQGLTISHVAVFIGGVLFTAVLLWLQGFWIYLEEKYKGTLRKKIEHFDKLEQYWQRKKN